MIKGFLFLLGGTVIAQVGTLVATPFLAQLYGPNLFGTLAILIGCVTIFSSIGSFKLDVAMQNVSVDKDYQSIVNCAFLINIFILLILGFILVVLSKFDVFFFRDDVKKVNLFFLFLGCTGIVFYNFAVSCALRDKAYRKAGFSRVLLIFSMLFLQFLLYPLSDLGLVLGYSLSFVFPVYILCLNYKIFYFNKFSFREIFFVCKKEYKFTLYTNISSLINAVGNQVHILFFGAYYGLDMVGLLMLSQKIISAPIKMIADSISKIIYTNKIDMEKENAILFVNIIFYVLVCSIPVFVVVFYFIEPLIVFFFGAEWVGAAKYSEYAIVLGGFTLIGMPLYNIMLKIGCNKSAMFFEFFMIAIRVSVLVLTFSFQWNSIFSVMVLFLVASLFWFFYIAYSLFFIGLSCFKIFFAFIFYVFYIFSLYCFLRFNDEDLILIVVIYSFLFVLLCFGLFSYVKKNNF
ncbi:oligosaccharide flippase family protein [Marinomonas rhizomae]|uniref:oligosaccharide flippase family protein n=1 Tax=Marinomonas rhizomae TaxID=491948 RepID=UPI002103A2BF|nr:oligosaccharide flippase family protein [Marinomonas rhizomae]UTW00167.1 oligosaccharide flippase family protein [Marinomonas rhizomae]